MANNIKNNYAIIYPLESTVLTMLEDGNFELELTWLEEHPQPYDLGECEFHLAFQVDDYEAAHKLHEEMGCICFENPAMGIYFMINLFNSKFLS